MPEQSPIRVLHTLSRLIPGGVERRTLELIKATKNEPVEHIVCVMSGQTGTLDEEYRAAGAELHYIRLRSPMFPFHFTKLLKHRSIDVVHAMLLNASGYILALARMAGVQNRIAQFRSDGDINPIGVKRRLNRIILRCLIDRCATQIVGLTPRNLEIAWNRFWEEDPRCKIVPNGVAMLVDLPEQAEELSRFSSHSVIIHAGRADIPSKNREKAISVFAEYARHRPKSVLIFVGRDGKDEAHVQENRIKWRLLTQEYGIDDQVYFLGEKSSVLPYFSAADVLLFTSTWEGLPGIILEALSTGLPVVSTDVPGAEFIADQGLDVQILNAHDSDEKWGQALLSKPDKLSAFHRKQHMRQFGDSIFDLETSVRNYLELWQA